MRSIHENSRIRKLVALTLWLAMVSSLLVNTACGGGTNKEADYVKADSLNILAYDWRYKDLETSLQAARKAYNLSASYPSQRAEALNNWAFCAFMRMDFEGAKQLYARAAQTSGNEIENLIADIGQMKICQRTSMNKEFYDFRNSALRRMHRIHEDKEQITDKHIGARLNYALSEFYIVSGIYYYYLQQHEASMQAIRSVNPEWIQPDTSQWLYYEYMIGSGDMLEADTEEATVEGEFMHLTNCLLRARDGGYVYFEANALQAMAELLVNIANRQLLEERRAGLLRLVNENNLPVDSLPLAFACKALELFKQYGDWYQISGTHRTLATYYNSVNQPEKALDQLSEALKYVNRHHERYYHCNDTTDRLRPFLLSDGKAIELKWIEDEGIYTVPEWILRLREQISRTYSAMGRKQESDYNRNIYLDLLDYTRQDKELESRYQVLNAEERQLNLLLSLVVVSFILLIVLFIVVNHRWRKRNRIYLSLLKRVFYLCRSITASVPLHAREMEEVLSAVEDTLRQEFVSLFHAVDVRLCLLQEGADNDAASDVVKPSDGTSKYHCMRLPLVSPGGEQRIGELLLTLPYVMRKDDKALVNLTLPYLAWTLENGLNLVSLDSERRRLEKERYIYEQHLIENKCQNVVKKACFSIVTGILPYIDRVINEVDKLQSMSYARQPEVRKNKFVYIGELIGKINEYNDILALWIKMRQGALSLNIENFSLDELFQIVAKGRRSFDIKHQTLLVGTTEAVVKADKALTLFMISTLIENARKYTQEGGTVELSAREFEKYIEIAVTDNGPGLSDEDVRRILGEKVYNSEAIGLNTTTDVKTLQQQKGYGFGLMNCKGIIEKYRKTNVLFNVCSFHIDSIVGQGSRFYFRLPKGMRRVVSVLFMPLLLLGLVSCSHGEPPAEKKTLVCDTLLVQANEFANKVYYNNVNGGYEEALSNADSVLHYMNNYYLKYANKTEPLLCLYSNDASPAEQVWLKQEFDIDYYILLDVRNEIAVAALALGDFDVYYYNNAAYVTLYKLISRDRSLQAYCEQMQRTANDKMIGIGLFCLLLVVCAIGYYVLYFRHRLHYRYNVEQVFDINRTIFLAARASYSNTKEGVFRKLIDCLYVEMDQLLPVSGMALAVYDEEACQLHYTFHHEDDNSEELCNLLQLHFNKSAATWSGASSWSCLPLWVEIAGKQHCIGVLSIKLLRGSYREEDLLLVELVASCLAVVLYNTVVRIRRKHYDIELAQDEVRRISFEENTLHVQNMVLDNCLSTIKHETIYYPNRIKQIIDRLDKHKNISDGEQLNQIQTISELMHYYKDIFTLLSSCAARQLDEVTFRRSDVDVSDLIQYVIRYFRKVQTKQQFQLELQTEIASNLKVSADRVLLSFLFRSLIDEAFRFAQVGSLCLYVKAEGKFARFDFVDYRRSFSQEELNLLFYPDRDRMCIDEASALKGTEYLICKQIVREHDEFLGCRGCRINATALPEGGFSVWFTIPLK